MNFVVSNRESPRLCVRRDGVFKIKDQGICGDGLGLFEGSFVRARHIEARCGVAGLAW
jgi:hypothetical protein